MHEFSTVDGFVEITESLADMIKFIASSEEDDERAPGYLSNVFRSAKQKASNFKWAQLEAGESRPAKSEPSSSDKDEPSATCTKDALLAADASSSSSVGRANSEDLMSSQTVDDELQQEQVNKSMSHDQLLSLSENFEEFKADKEAKLEEWLGEEGILKSFSSTYFFL
ncbi:hypothetical protein K7X08_022776 [Anisodus acutangulus]|uniref:Uncharacterized protein n=1 Tax=Anisodus acutangulus TaxID=402998 RepID=A0A9Q1MB76_9SOLA|nr:hypothetical protein K7X08_022776 [Anisodus acutangulus]